MSKILKLFVISIVMIGIMNTSMHVLAEKTNGSEELYEESADMPLYMAVNDVDYSKELENIIVAGLKNMKTEVDVSGFDISRSEVSSIVFHIISMHPEFFYVENYISWVYNSEEVIKVKFTYTETADQVQQMQQEIDDTVEHLLGYIDRETMNDFELVMMVHDYFASTMRYATGEVTSSHIYDIYGALVEGTPVCQGYTEAFMYVLNMLEIPTGFVSSTNANHAWNIVMLDGNWYHLDITFDDPLDNQLGRARHDYFLISTDTLLSLAPARTDFCVETSRDYEYQEATDKTFESGNIWNETDTMIYQYQGNWYYVNLQNQIIKHQPDTQQEEVIAELDSYWYSPRLFGISDDLYATDGLSVYQIDLNTYETEKLETIDSNDYRVTIIGVGMNDGDLAYQLSDRTSGYTEYYICPLGIHVRHNWGIISKTKMEIVQKCTSCGEERVIKLLSLKAVRIMGQTRYETSLEIADALKEQLEIAKYENVILTSGQGFADALAGSYLAAMKNAPIIMVDPVNNNMSEISAYLDENLASGGMIYILGGTAAVPSFVEDALIEYNTTRLSGSDRYVTNLMILNEAGVSNQPLLVCYGQKFADSLSASATGLPLLLVNKTLTDSQKQFLEEHAGTSIYVLGGTAAISSALEKELGNYGTVTRIAGNTRYETSVAIAKAFFTGAKQVVLAYAENYPDGLCGGPLAFTLNAPMILTSTSKAKTAANYTSDFSITSGVVLGGPKLISDAAVEEILGSEPELY